MEMVCQRNNPLYVSVQSMFKFCLYPTDLGDLGTRESIIYELGDTDV